MRYYETFWRAGLIPHPPKDSPGYQVRITHRAFDRMLAGRLAKFGLKSGYWYYLRVLWINEGLTQKELSDAINVKETTTVTMLKGMERDALVVRKRDDHDRRKICIFLTQKARKLEAALLPIGLEINDIALQSISSKDVKTCLKVLKQMRENLHATS